MLKLLLRYISVVTVILFIGQKNLLAQEKIWFKMANGDALYLDPVESSWIPLSSKSEIPLQTYIITKKETRASIFQTTEVIQLPSDAYLFVEDALPKTKLDLVKALTRIEAEQLPGTTNKTTSSSKKIGLTYGSEIDSSGSNSLNAIPYFEERMNAIHWFYENKRSDAALVTLKRLLVKFPAVYLDVDNFNLLCNLYEELELYGFLYRDSNFVLELNQASKEIKVTAQKWSDTANIQLRSKK